MKRYSGLRSSNKSQNYNSNSKLIFGARVQYVILDDKTHPEIFKQFGEWNSIGGLLFHNLGSPSTFKDINFSNFAKPLFPNQRNFPLENEIVYIISLPSNEIESNINSTEYYYFQPINLWNSVHHNAIPDALGNKLTPKSQQQDYQQTEAGSVRRVTDGSTEIPLGSTFKERLDIRNLLPFEGDIIYEGRWGQSIRFGSTIKDGNLWSKSGNNGDPIIIIRNGQFYDNKDPWIPITEDINQDSSSIYVTSTQQIPIQPSSEDYNSYKSPPTKISEYKEPQIILSSNRLVFNAKKDDILFCALKSINLNSQDSVNIDSKKSTIIQSPEIKLGDKDASESMILGDKFLSDLSKILKQLSSLCSSLPTVGTVTPYTPNTQVAIESTKLKVLVDTMNNSIESFKSKINKIK